MPRASRVRAAAGSCSSHILPNAIGVIIVNTTLLMSATILTEAAIGFLGFGVQAPDVSLGKLIYDFQTAFQTRPWLFWWPGIFIVLIALTINFIGDGLRDAFDPRQKRALNRARPAGEAEPHVPRRRVADGRCSDVRSPATAMPTSQQHESDRPSAIQFTRTVTPVPSTTPESR